MPLADSVKLDITISEGEDSIYVLTLVTSEDGEDTPVDLTGCGITSQVRLSAEEDKATDPLLDLTCAVTDAASGEFTLSASAEDVAELDFSALQRAVYDVKFSWAGGVTRRYIHGQVLFARGVTA